MNKSDSNPYAAPRSTQPMSRPQLPDPQSANPPKKANWKTWSPFQSATVRQIVANLTPKETSMLTRRGFCYGIWVAVSFVLPGQFLTLGVLTKSLNPTYAIIAGILMLVHIAFVPFWLRIQRQILSNTEWARENSINADDLRLFRWRI